MKKQHNIESDISQALWLSRFVLGAIITVSLAGGNTIYNMAREVSQMSVKVNAMYKAYEGDKNVFGFDSQLGHSGDRSGWAAASGEPVFFCSAQAPAGRTHFQTGAGWPGPGGGAQGLVARGSR